MSTIDRFREVRSNYAGSVVSKETRDGIIFALPYVALFSVFLLYPMGKGFYMSLLDWNQFAPGQSPFIWFDNYTRMVNDPRFWTSLRATLVFVILIVPSMVIGGLLLALGANQQIKGRRLLRFIYFSPYVLTVSVVALIWQELLAPDYGPVNYYLGFIIQNPPTWLESFTWAMPAIAATTFWWKIGFNFVILLAARQSVPERLYEAARLDGASTWHAFKDITLPQMKHALVFVTIVQFIYSFQVFGQPFIMTQGGPGYSTETLVMYIYRMAFRQGEFGFAAAMGYFLFVVLVGVSLVNFKMAGGANRE
jgi:multiple sugar transport system permease protein